jgi:hypothetical protein
MNRPRRLFSDLVVLWTPLCVDPPKNVDDWGEGGFTFTPKPGKLDLCLSIEGV